MNRRVAKSPKYLCPMSIQNSNSNEVFSSEGILLCILIKCKGVKYQNSQNNDSNHNVKTFSTEFKQTKKQYMDTKIYIYQRRVHSSERYVDTNLFEILNCTGKTFKKGSLLWSFHVGSSAFHLQKDLSLLLSPTGNSTKSIISHNNL